MPLILIVSGGGSGELAPGPDVAADDESVGPPTGWGSGAGTWTPSTGRIVQEAGLLLRSGRPAAL
jgi:hypothetical protein